jgi:glycosyltransferase involved in cell wall biosynthesis
VRTVQPTVGGRVLANLRRPQPLLPLQVRLFCDAGMERAMAEELAAFRPDVVHVTLARLGPYLPAPGPWHRHLDLIDALSVNMRTRAAAARFPAGAALALEAGLMARYEARLAGEADSASVVAEADRRAGPGLDRVAVIPNGVDLGAFPFRSPAERPPVLIFFGNLGYFHALEPTRFVAADVLPLVRTEVPDARLEIVGARPAAAVRRLDAEPGVEVVGPVDRMADALGRAAVAVVPMFSGSGMKNKVLEAFCSGTPVVTNAAGIEGVDGARPGVHFLQAEGAEAIARACAELLRDPALRTRLAEAARALVEAEYTWARRAQQLLDLYHCP